MQCSRRIQFQTKKADTGLCPSVNSVHVWYISVLVVTIRWCKDAVYIDFTMYGRDRGMMWVRVWVLPPVWLVTVLGPTKPMRDVERTERPPHCNSTLSASLRRQTKRGNARLCSSDERRGEERGCQTFLSLVWLSLLSSDRLYCVDWRQPSSTSLQVLSLLSWLEALAGRAVSLGTTGEHKQRSSVRERER